VIILGIDPGTRRTGYAVIETGPDIPYLLVSGILAPSPRLPFPERLLEIYRGLFDVVANYSPDEMAVESVFVKHNISTA